MDINQSYLSAIKAVTHSSLDSCREWVRNNPMTGDFVVHQLLQDKALAMKEDGSVVGVKTSAEVKQAGGPNFNVSTEWKSTWPQRSFLESIIMDNQPVKLREIQEYLKQAGQPNGHWFVLHAIWALMKLGVVSKEGKGYSPLSASVQKNTTLIDILNQVIAGEQNKKTLGDIHALTQKHMKMGKNELFEELKKLTENGIVMRQVVDGNLYCYSVEEAVAATPPATVAATVQPTV